MKIKFKNKKIEILVKEVSELGKVRGLMFRRREKSRALLFNFSKDVTMKIHSWFVFFPFVAIWLDEKNNVLDFKIVNSWVFSILPSTKNFRKLIEIPFNKRYSKILKSLDGQKV